MAAGAEAAQMPFIKNLASSDRKLRTESLAALQTFLSSRTSLPSADALKLWTGLYYALWMTDRPRPQQALAADLASLALDLRPGCTAPWLGGAWAVLSSQWPSIDALRLDKFLLLARRLFAVHVRWAARHQYAGAEVDDVLRGLADACFDVGDHTGVALGLRLHVLDLWVDELEREGALKAVAAGDDAAREFVARIGAMVDALRVSPPKAVRQRAADSYSDARLPWAEQAASSDGEDGDAAGGDGDDDDDGWGGIDD